MVYLLQDYLQSQFSSGSLSFLNNSGHCPPSQPSPQIGKQGNKQLLVKQPFGHPNSWTVYEYGVKIKGHF